MISSLTPHLNISLHHISTKSHLLKFLLRKLFPRMDIQLPSEIAIWLYHIITLFSAWHILAPSIIHPHLKSQLIALRFDINPSPQPITLSNQLNQSPQRINSTNDLILSPQPITSTNRLISSLQPIPSTNHFNPSPHLPGFQASFLRQINAAEYPLLWIQRNFPIKAQKKFRLFTSSSEFMTLFDVAMCGVALCGMVRRCNSLCGVAMCGLARCDITLRGGTAVLYVTMWFGTGWCETLSYSTVWKRMKCYGTSCYVDKRLDSGTVWYCTEKYDTA